MAKEKTYDPNVPEKLSDALAVSQLALLANFQTMFSAFSRNHVALDSTDFGNHTIIELFEQLNAIETNVNEISIYTKFVKDQTEQVFFRYPGNGTEFQFTNYQIYTAKKNQFFTTLPGGFLCYFGSFKRFTPSAKVTKFNLDLLPVALKKICSIALCPTELIDANIAGGKTLNASTNPSAYPNDPTNGFISSINISRKLKLVGGNSPVTVPACNYFIIGKV